MATIIVGWRRDNSTHPVGAWCFGASCWVPGCGRGARSHPEYPAPIAPSTPTRHPAPSTHGLHLVLPHIIRVEALDPLLEALGVPLFRDEIGRLGVVDDRLLH